MKMKTFGFLIFGVGLWSFSTFAQTEDEKTKCSFYSKVGSSVVEFVLPLKVQDMVDMLAGNNPDLMDKMSSAMLQTISADEFRYLVKTENDKVGLLSQSAGEVAFQLLMSGQATNGHDVGELLFSSCLQVGSETIIQNQFKSNQAAAGNIPQE